MDTDRRGVNTNVATVGGRNDPLEKDYGVRTLAARGPALGSLRGSAQCPESVNIVGRYGLISVEIEYPIF